MVKFRRSKIVLPALLLILSTFVNANPDHPVIWPEDHQRMIEYAHLFEGAPYSYGARKPASEDCSSFVQKIYAMMGIELPRSSREQAQDDRFTEVPKENIKAGDLVFFRNTYRRGISHVAFMIDENTMLHASPKGKRVARDTLHPKHPLWKKIHSIKRWRNSMEGDFITPQFSWD